MSYGIRAERLTKIFRVPGAFPLRGPAEVAALRGVDLEVDAGELFCLLGPNGAGKSTLLRILATLVLPTAGRAWVGGCSVLEAPHAVKKVLGLVAGDERSFYWRLTGRQNLFFFGTLHDLRPREIRGRIQQVAELLDLESFLDRRFGTYSTGMRQRLLLARGLLHSPGYLLIDEPTRGLDPGAAHRLRGILRHLVKEEGVTALVVTHSVEEARELADRVGLIEEGNLRIFRSQDIDLHSRCRQWG